MLEHLLYPIINFTLYVGCIIWLYKRYGRGPLAARSVSVKHHLESAQAMLRSAEALYAEAEERRAALTTEQTELREQTIAEGKKVALRIVEQAKRQAREIEESAERQVRMNAEQTRRELRRELISDVIADARKQLSSVSSEVDRRLCLEAIENLQ